MNNRFDTITVISGGQTGVDQLGLFLAKTIGLFTGGTAPLDFKTEHGSSPWLAEAYGLVESNQKNYAHRTRRNVEDADITLIFGDVSSKGSSQTIDFCEVAGKPFLVNPRIIDLKDKIHDLKVEDLVINIAGNRASRCSVETLSDTAETLSIIFKWLESHTYIHYLSSQPTLGL